MLGFTDRVTDCGVFGMFAILASVKFVPQVLDNHLHAI